MKWLQSVGLCAVSLVSATAVAQSQPIHPATLSSASGRYVFGQINHLARDQYMLDTQTGRLWQLTCIKSQEADPSKCQALVLQAVPYDTMAGQFEAPPAPQSFLYGPRKKADDVDGKK